MRYPSDMRNFILCLGFASVASACGEQMHGGGETAYQIKFKAVVGQEDFTCARTFTGLGTSAASWEPRDFRFYVHDVVLVHGPHAEPLTLDEDGTWQSGGVALLDFEDKSGGCANGTTPTRTVVTGKVAHEHDYHTVRFKLGVPFALNHADAATAPSPLNLTELWWNWNGGYKFLRIDGKTPALGYNIHIGATGCTPMGANQVTACSNGNRAEVSVDVDPKTGTILVDLAQLLAQTDLLNDPKMPPPGCMSGVDDGACTGIFASLGLDLASGAPRAGQTFFRAAP
jgi:uncharacterized repeat protein (TIGR04052 family)